MLTFSKNSSRPASRRQHQHLAYSTLEDRRLLATVSSLDVSTGTLTVEFTDFNDQAIIDIQSGLVTINGNTDVDSTLPGAQTIDFSDLRHLVFSGDPAKTLQSIVLNGDFTNLAGAGMQSITVENLNNVTVNGSYQLSSDLIVSMSGESGEFSDARFGQLIVAGQTTIDAGRNAVILNNMTHDFIGAVSLSTSDSRYNSGQYVTISDINDIEFADVTLAQNLKVKAGGDVTDVDGSVIEVAGAGNFLANNVVLGNDPNDTTNFGRVTFRVSGQVQFSEDSDVSFTGWSTIGSLAVTSSGGIEDGIKTGLSIAGSASFDAVGRIWLGDLNGDLFNAGQLTFNSSGFVDIFENSTTEIVGDNTAGSLKLTSWGDIIDDEFATIEVKSSSGFVAQNVVLGDTQSDNFRSASIYFDVVGNFFLSEDDGINIAPEDNFANRLELTSLGAITDGVTTAVTVSTLAKFDALSVTIGDQATDQFNAGWVQFNTTNRFNLEEDSSTLLVNNNTAGSVTIISTGTIESHELSSIEITGVASFSGTGITIGLSAVDVFNAGSLELNSTGDVTIVEDSNSVFAGSSQVDLLRITSAGVISDQSDATLNVDRVAMMTATGIVLGDTETDEFNATAITVHVSGNVVIRENSGTHLTGDNFANAMNLTADGNISDNEFASIDVEYLLRVTGDMINLGTEATESFRSGMLSFNSNLTTNIRSQETITLVGASHAGRLILESDQNILDVAAETVADEAFLSAVDVILGDAGECFDVLPANVAVVATGIDDVTITFGCSS